MKTIKVINQSNATAIGEKIAVADTFLSRLVGLMGKRNLPQGTGLWIMPSSGVHTCWMRMSIDVVALDRSLQVIDIGHSVPPWRLSGLKLKTHSVLELPPGQAMACGLELGDQLAVMPSSGTAPKGEDHA